MESGSSAIPATRNVVALLRPDIAGNVGAIGRLCAVTGWHLAVVRPIPFALSDRSARRAGLDYWEHLSWSDHTSWEDFLAALGPGREPWLVETGGRQLFGTLLGPRPVLVLGSEGEGLPAALLDQHRDRVVSLPMPGSGARSLNVAQCAAVAVYEAIRQGSA